MTPPVLSVEHVCKQSMSFFLQLIMQSAVLIGKQSYRARTERTLFVCDKHHNNCLYDYLYMTTVQLTLSKNP